VPQGQAAASVRPALFAPLHPTPGAPDPAAIDLLMDVPLQVTVELGRTRLSVREVLGLGTGSVVELDRFAGEPIDLLVNDRLIARGEVVVIDESFGVRVTEIVRSGQGAAAHRPA
jgi:flagellar motor switch protein FliN/FliY